MKKVISLVLILVVLISCFSVVYADEGLEKLTLSVKQRLEIPEEYTEFKTNTRWDKNGRQIVYFEWETAENDFINVSATTNGIITDYYNSKGGVNRGISKISAKEAAQIANSFMQKVNADIASEYIFKEDDVQKNYGISIIAERYVGNARVAGDQASITLNGDTGEVVSLYVLYTDYAFDSQEGIISLDDAKVKFYDQTELSICYIDGKDGNIMPVYIDYKKLYEDEFVIDAFTGEKVDYARTFEGLGSAGPMYDSMNNMKEEAADGIYLTENELKDLAKYDNYITKEDAEKKLKGIKEFGIEKFTLQSASYNTKYVWKNDKREEQGMNLYLNLVCGKFYARATLNAQTGEILSFYQTEGNESDAKISNKDAEALADNFMKKITDKKYMKAYSAEKNGVSQNIYLEEVETAPYINNETMISVDLKTGLISNYSNGFKEYDKAKVISWGQSIANNMAHKVYINGSGYELAYMDIYGTTAMPLYKIEVKDEPEKVYKLFYRIKEKPYAVDALTGELLKMGGEAYETEEISFTDIEGHWCESAVKALIENNYLEVDKDEFEPDKHITKAEAQKMMESADLYRYEIEKAEDAVFNRSEAAKAIVCGAGYEKVGALSDVYIPVFADWNSIYDGNKGYVAIAKGLGIIKGDKNGFFYPMDNVTKGAFAVMIYNYILSGISSY